MGTAERKEREKQQRKFEILSAAENLFFSNGYENTTMEDLANKVELSKGTLYLYFKNKDDLMLAIVQKAMSKLHELFVEHSSKEENGLCKIRAIGEAFIRFFYEYNDYYNIMKYQYGNPSAEKDDCKICEEIDKLKVLNNDYMVNILKNGITDGSIRSDLDPNKTSLLLWGESMGVLQLASMEGKSLNNHFGITSDELIKYFFEFTYNALKA